MTEARRWARTASAGDYLSEYGDDGLDADSDPGNRCGYGDDELAEIGAILAIRGLTLEANDRGLVAAHRVETVDEIEDARERHGLSLLRPDQHED